MHEMQHKHSTHIQRWAFSDGRQRQRCSVVIRDVSHTNQLMFVKRRRAALAFLEQKAKSLAEETEQDENEVPGTPPGITYDEDITTVTAAVTVSQIQQLVDCPICIAVEVADEGYANLKDAADYAYHLNQMRLYKISCDEAWDPETGSFNSRPSTPPTEMEIEENCMQIVAMMTPVEDTPTAADAEASAARSTTTTHTLTDQDVERLCELAENEGFEEQMEMTESDSDTEEADYDSSESDVGITAKFKMSWHPRLIRDQGQW